MQSDKDPLRKRKYLHFDERPARSVIERWVTDPARVARWQFFPLLSLNVVTTKVKAKDKWIGEIESKEKSRPICYAAHSDAALYAHYAATLGQQYEQMLHAQQLDDCVTAFRPSGGRCNIHFAVEAFGWIADHRPCVALAFDITGFFDNLDHRLLRQKLCEVLSVDTLPPDHYAIFRSLTRFARVDRDRVFQLFKISRHNPYAAGRKRICTTSEFRNKVVAGGLIERNRASVGIPQGTPISALMSNIYMLDFDRRLSAYVAVCGGLYRRYCDDILCVVPPERANEAIAEIEAAIAEVKLSAQPDKQGSFSFVVAGPPLSPPLQYLGLTFDGIQVRLRTGSIARYYARMRSGVRSAARSRDRVAREASLVNLTVPIKLGKLLETFAYTGGRNFISYALRASRVSNSSAIKRQVSRHLPALRAYLKSRK